MKSAAIIPARYASTRFPGKPLVDILGKTMIQRVYETCKSSMLFDEVIVATDSREILENVISFGGIAMLTSESHPSGTDRVAELARDLDVELILNVQGDEPLITADVLKPLMQAFADPEVTVASLMTQITEPEQVSDPNVVKVVCDRYSNALYFSRSPIPFDRDGSGAIYYRHIGVYAYRKNALLSFVSLPQTPYEKLEKLEQLRLLENGFMIKMVQTAYQGIGIDSPTDLPKVEAILQGSSM